MNAPMPDHLGRFSLERVLGQGSMGTVYEAVDPTLQRRVAIKVLHRARLEVGSKDFATRFRREARVGARLAHPNIVAIHEFGEQDGVSYIVMELVNGGDLRNRFSTGKRVPFNEAVHILLQLLDALAYAHAKHVVHRDIKPSNVMLTASGQVKLTDFGIAWFGDSNDERTQVGTVLGTPMYMAPEQFQGGSADARSDIYAVGAILYELLTGVRPFSGTSFELIKKVMLETPTPPSRVDRGIPAAFDRIVARALAKAPEDRYTSAQAFKADLEGVLSRRDSVWRRLWSLLPAFRWLGPRLVPSRTGAERATDDEPPQGNEATSPSRTGPVTLPPADDGPVQADPARTLFVPADGASSPWDEAGAAGADYTVIVPRSQGTDAPRPGPVGLLVVQSDVGSMVGARFALDRPVTRLGRGNGDIDLPDMLLSREHARIELGTAGLTICDDGSANGTFVNGFRLTPREPYPLLPGAHVRVGSTVLVVLLEQEHGLRQLTGIELAGRYVMEECLHASPKGATYRACEKQSRLPVAVKLLAPGYASWPGYRESFAHEVEIALTLQHPHICTLRGHGQAEIELAGARVVVPFLAYEMLAGGSLGSRLAKVHELPTKRLVGWISDLAAALDYVHRSGLVHGGLKPSAVCLDGDDNVYLTDFAPARAQSGGVSAQFGAPAFMAPEQWQGQAPTAASDQYALGVLAYLLLSGVRPYEGQEEPQTRERNFTAPPPPLHAEALRRCQRRLVQAATQVVNRALSIKPEKRHESVATFAERLALALSGEPLATTAERVFISYERGPTSSAWVTLIAQVLEREHGIRCFVDTMALDRAERFPPRIRSAIQQCEVFVCVLGPTTLQSPWVRTEIAHASRFQKTMVPVLLEGFTETSADLKVRSIRKLLQYGGEHILDQQHLFITEALNRIVRRIRSGLAGTEDAAFKAQSEGVRR